MCAVEPGVSNFPAVVSVPSPRTFMSQTAQSQQLEGDESQLPVRAI